MIADKVTIRKGTLRNREEGQDRNSVSGNFFGSITDILLREHIIMTPPSMDLSYVSESTAMISIDEGIKSSIVSDDDASSVHLPSPPRLNKSTTSEFLSFLPIEETSFDSFGENNISLLNPATNSRSITSRTFGSASFADDSSTFAHSILSGNDPKDTTRKPDTCFVGFNPLSQASLDQSIETSELIPSGILNHHLSSIDDQGKRNSSRYVKISLSRSGSRVERDINKKNPAKDQPFSSMCMSTPKMFVGNRDDASNLFTQLTTVRCGMIDDALAGMFDDDSSESSSDSQTIFSSNTASSIKYGRKSKKKLARKQGKANSRMSSHRNSDTSVAYARRLEVQDSESNKLFIQEIIQEGYQLIWHRPSYDQYNLEYPTDVVVFLELGFLQVEDNFAGPRLAWYNNAGTSLGAIDLLDIQSLMKPSPLHLDEFPYAMPGRTMVMTFQNSQNAIVLEAVSPEASFRFIRGIRWIVARFAFHLTMGEIDVCCELMQLCGISNQDHQREKDKVLSDMTKQLIDKTLFSNPQQLV